ncbi:Uncharacterized protein conserved in bacteria [Klebsiella michiganensis]|uniref:Uncharacterized protein conserved in bacteria n=1 Tax=Klebsiella michiganensis TaxID=1134687 RepID=A0A7H4M2I4_9ENTR|nr:Uncharacterized protein conserved in bacteria [Klebsiella michiganensis]
MTDLFIYETSREEQQELASELNDRAVVDYLLQHPEFFIRNAALVEHMSVPHPVRGSVSLWNGTWRGRGTISTCWKRI